jgi:DNA-binding NtrC family response regulator
MPERLLVVADDALLQLTLAPLLHRAGLCVLIARSIPEARSLLRSEQPAAMLLDLAMSSGDAPALIAELRLWPESPLVIGVTADSSSAAVIEAQRLGVFDCLTRPLSPELLWAAALRAIEHYRLSITAREIEHLRAIAETVGAAARTAAHHLSQHLTVIMGETQLLHEELTDPETRASLDRILRATEYSAQTLANLRASCHLID